MTWEIFLGIVAIISFCAAVTTPMIKLNTSITKLNDSVDTLQKAIDKIEAENEKSHARIWEHIDTQDEKIDNAEKDIVDIKHKIELLHHN